MRKDSIKGISKFLKPSLLIPSEVKVDVEFLYIMPEKLELKCNNLDDNDIDYYDDHVINFNFIVEYLNQNYNYSFAQRFIISLQEWQKPIGQI